MVLNIKSVIKTRILETFNGKSLEKAQIRMKLSMDKYKLIPEVHVTIKNSNVPLNRTLMENIDPERIVSCCINDIDDNEKELNYILHKSPFVKDVLSPKSRKLVGDLVSDRRNILVEFSSPNIAKPFHVGHLRSTIIGNFISNLYTHLNQNVKRLNYLGDWGTQFGILNIGIDLAKLSDEDIKANPIKSLYEAYVLANQLSNEDPTINEKAKEIFAKLESGQYEAIDRWKMYKTYTIDELDRVYKRLGVTFDHYFWESDYGKREIQTVLHLLNDKGVLHDIEDGRKVVKVGEREIPIVKSDGTTLYLTRDVAAFMDRYEKFKFDKLLYVVDHSQKNHFKALFSVANQLELPYAKNGWHVQFGRIQGMSTRKGTAVFLQDILNEAKTIMRQKQEKSATTRIDLSNIDDETSDILGISAVIVNDLKQKRTKDYEFNWDNALQVTGDTGIKLQYTHCRLCSLEKMVGVEEATECVPELLSNCEAVILAYEIARFEEILEKTEATLEACYLVNYLFSLCNKISRALKTLPVKSEPSRLIQSQRMLLFNTARRRLKQGMEILGLKPLNEM